MNMFTYTKGILAASLLTLTMACSDSDNPSPHLPESEKYVLITMSENSLEKPGYATAFNALPSGNISNATDSSLQGMGFGGWRPEGNRMFKMFSTSSNSLGIEELVIDANGRIQTGKFLAAANKPNGSGNFAIVDETHGFYWDGDRPLAVQTFDPSSLSRTGEIDLSEVVNERGSDEAGITFRSIGQKFLAVKEGKLYANITYANSEGPQQGFFDDFYSDVYLAVIDIESGAYEKTIRIENTGSIAYVNDNKMYDFDSNGDLYLITQGVSAVGGQSKISRIKAGETEIDGQWSLEMDEINPHGGKFVGLFVKDGKIITLIPNAPLTGGPNGNINFSDVWVYHIIDPSTNELTKIQGVPPVTNPGAAYCAIEVDGKVLLRVNTQDGKTNGYYELQGDQARPLFHVTAGGSVSGLYKVNADF
ncbi:MAG TPA: hypothetical protein H9825_07865 [Candidatus Sphingobacterium stercorigallinarum]|nr:hypothetical protein [Candidatus Sphingobacterium stercorigallinarum]